MRSRAFTFCRRRSSLRQRVVHLNLIAHALDEFLLLGTFDLDQMIVRRGGRSNELVELQLQRGLLTILRVFNAKSNMITIAFATVENPFAIVEKSP